MIRKECVFTGSPFCFYLSLSFMFDTYRTIAGGSEGIFKDKGSKFLAFAVPVRTADEVRDMVKEYRKKYYDARHVCYAYVLGVERTEFRANDDGEPSGTAGKPILGQLNSRELTDVLVVVIRYFGGILLGTSGLIHAYREATVAALDEAQVVERVVYCEHTLVFEYPTMNQVMRIVKEEDVVVVDSRYEMDCVVVVSVPKVNDERLVSRVLKLEVVRLDEE